MNRLLTFFIILGLSACCASNVNAANLLINGDLDLGTHEVDTNPPWTLDEFKGAVPAENPGTFASFANHTPNPVDPLPDPDTTRVGLWARNFEGTTAVPATVDLYQDVPGLPLTPYTLSGWARFEQFYNGGLTNYPFFNTTTNEFELLPSPTDTFLAIDFLGPGDALISTAQVELKANGQTNNNQWMQHFVTATSPVGTVEVRARFSAKNMVAVSGAQSAFGDDFNLEIVPEPTSVALGLTGLLGLMGLVRRR
jgi:hypothetical protein